MVVALSVVAAASGGVAAQAPSCDRACLSAIVDTYLAALVAHDPSKAPMARGARFTENTGVLEVGEGLWVGASAAPTTFKIYVPDPATSQIGFLGMLQRVRSPGAAGPPAAGAERPHRRGRAHRGAVAQRQPG